MLRNFRRVEISGDKFCLLPDTSRCKFTVWVRQYGQYSCKLYGKILKGNALPLRCKECVADDTLLPLRETKGR